jgi:hypothetical protein
MNTTVYNKLIFYIENINNSLQKIQQESDEYIIKYLNNDYGIVLSLEYLRDETHFKRIQK